MTSLMVLAALEAYRFPANSPKGGRSTGFTTSGVRWVSSSRGASSLSASTG
jgi:hypothetical protein